MKRDKSTVLFLIIFLIGLSVLLYPTLSNFWNSHTQSRLIMDYKRTLEGMSPSDFTSYLEDAHKYNEQLAKLDYPLIQYDRLQGYEDLLRIDSSTLMGYISIKKINLELPIYHNTSEGVLNAGVGHLQGSSLPIGGRSTHTVLSAHRGLPTSKLFTNIDKLEEGDTFDITVLNEKLRYEVDLISVVEPENTDLLNIVEDEDYCSLVTCTPYAINTHRLIVRGRRTEFISDELNGDSMDMNHNDILIPIISLLSLLLILCLIILLKPRWDKKNR